MNEAAMARRQEWKDNIEKWQSSGKTIAAWCRDNNIPYNTFQNWRKRLRFALKNNKEGSASFIELQEDDSIHSGVRLHFKGVSLYLSEKFDEATLMRCLHMLRGFRC